MGALLHAKPLHRETKSELFMKIVLYWWRRYVAVEASPRKKQKPHWHYVAVEVSPREKQKPQWQTYMNSPETGLFFCKQHQSIPNQDKCLMVHATSTYSGCTRGGGGDTFWTHVAASATSPLNTVTTSASTGWYYGTLTLSHRKLVCSSPYRAPKLAISLGRSRRPPGFN
jgi:hypothetical protein